METSSKTRFSETHDVVYLGADVYPGRGVDANSRMSFFACLAHELAHAERFRANYRRPAGLPDVLLDEAETSLRASFAPRLLQKDREDLVEDARDRLIHWLSFHSNAEKVRASMKRAERVETSGVTLTDVCDVTTKVCTARTTSTVTQVWAPPGRTALYVCKACLEERVRRGEWRLEESVTRSPRRGWAPVIKAPTVEVEPTGVVMTAVCTIQGETCCARTPYPITAVWGPPGRTQINVCGECLDEKFRRGDWYIEGARLEPRPGRSS